MGVDVVQTFTRQFSAVDERKLLWIGYHGMVLYTLQVLIRGADSLYPPTCTIHRNSDLSSSARCRLA